MLKGFNVRLSLSRVLLLSSIALLGGILLLARSTLFHVNDPVFSDDQLAANSIISIDSRLPNTNVVIDGKNKQTDDLFRGKWTMFVVCSRLIPTAVYHPQFLAATWLHRGFQYIFVLPPNQPSPDLIPSNAVYTVAHTSDGVLAKRLHLPSAGDYAWSFLVDPNGHIRFSQPSPIRDDVQRQLIEKYIRGTIEYNVSRKQPANFVGNLPSFAAVDYRTGRQIDSQELLRSAELVMFFPAYANQENLNAILPRISSVIAAHGGHRAIVVLSAFYVARGLVQNGSLPHQDQLNYMVAKAVVPGWEDPYYAGADYPTAVALSVSGGRVTKAEELLTWLRQSEDAR